jgi:hypothetical protein
MSTRPEGYATKDVSARTLGTGHGADRTRPCPDVEDVWCLQQWDHEVCALAHNRW